MAQLRKPPPPIKKAPPLVRERILTRGAFLNRISPDPGVLGAPEQDMGAADLK